jgi:hypothetical protein
MIRPCCYCEWHLDFERNFGADSSLLCRHLLVQLLEDIPCSCRECTVVRGNVEATCMCCQLPFALTVNCRCRFVLLLTHIESFVRTGTYGWSGRR